MHEKDLNYEFQNGKVLLIDKELDWSSFDIVNKIRIVLKTHLGIRKIKVGHTGTLDPLATGLVIVCTGKATKKIEAFVNLDKEYIASIKLGETTPSYDLETEVNSRYPYDHVDEMKVLDVCKKFTGEYDQVPPLYSAKYVQGTRAYELARRGDEVKLKPNRVRIVNIQLVSFESPILKIRILCSKGTYIRALARDIGDSLKCGAHLTELRRTRIGNYKVEEACTIRIFEENLTNNRTIGL
jgi:tRNA pseudouridine55 synthase